MAYASNEMEVSLQISGDIYKIDLQGMIQQNQTSGIERPIQRRVSMTAASKLVLSDRRRRLGVTPLLNTVFLL